MQVGAMFSMLAGRRALRPDLGLAWLVRLVAGSIRLWVQERDMRRTIIELRRADDFLLLDLGIRHDQIEEAVRHGRFDLEPCRRSRSRR
ncbi:MAG TPA: hypothetical protein VHL31_22230 [Geminicoccus sp.]|jgi:uncharacterized protein YjiS (DUF1127 family)|uniref:hypothetical protein n=1 Tax=Geminicoccus sp. TaxID=2024832 RepID=UPI002E2EF4E9|nr:hypothetical protein [Geminicoccus sp.]HEX2529000.1 hypothetical protein [Geminicoccus sp.]